MRRRTTFLWLFSITFIALQSCQDEPFESSSSADELIAEAKAWYQNKGEEFDLKKIKNRTGDVLWDKASIDYIDEGDFYKIRVPMRNDNMPKDNRQKLSIHISSSRISGYILRNVSKISQEDKDAGYTRKLMFFNKRGLWIKTAYYKGKQWSKTMANPNKLRTLITLKNYDEGCEDGYDGDYECLDEACVGDCDDEEEEEEVCEDVCNSACDNYNPYDCHGGGNGDGNEDCNDPCDYECNNYDPDTCNNGGSTGGNGNNNGNNSGDSGPQYQFPAELLEIYQGEFPKLVELVEERISCFLEDEHFLNTLSQYSYYSPDQLQDIFQYGQGPLLRIEDHTGVGDGEFPALTRTGLFDENTILLNTEAVDNFENGDHNYDTEDGMVNLLTMTMIIAHETCHHGDYYENNSQYFNTNNELGDAFEEAYIASDYKIGEQDYWTDELRLYVRDNLNEYTKHCD